MLEISVAAGEAGPVMTLAGEADLTNAAALGEALAAQVSGGTRHATRPAPRRCPVAGRAAERPA
jgi:hypothetical protein